MLLALRQLKLSVQGIRFVKRRRVVVLFLILNQDALIQRAAMRCALSILIVAMLVGMFLVLLKLQFAVADVVMSLQEIAPPLTYRRTAITKRAAYWSARPIHIAVQPSGIRVVRSKQGLFALIEAKVVVILALAVVLSQVSSKDVLIRVAVN
jgi:hypothetical protein